MRIFKCLVVMPFVPCSFWLLVLRPGAPSSVRSLLVAMPGAPSSVRSLLVAMPGAPSSVRSLLVVRHVLVKTILPIPREGTTDITLSRLDSVPRSAAQTPGDASVHSVNRRCVRPSAEAEMSWRWRRLMCQLVHLAVRLVASFNHGMQQLPGMAKKWSKE